MRGLAGSGVLLLLGMLTDLRFRYHSWHPVGLVLMTGMGLVIGITAFCDAWLWAGMPGPVHRLTTRACGVGKPCAVRLSR
jgi:hypothetical protein